MNILDKVKNGFVYFDGGCGSILQEQGLMPGEFPERWNILHPERLIDLHFRYLMAGANILKTNTFGANALKFALQSDEPCDSLEEVIKAGVANARTAIARAKKAKIAEGTLQAGDPYEAYVALDIGPTGKLLEPYGDLPFEKAVEIFAQVVKIGTACEVDLILIETMNDSYEAKAAVLAAKENSHLPVFVTTVYDESGKLLTGANPQAMVAMLEGLRVDAIGMNCSLGPEQMKHIVPKLANVASIPVIVNPNAGLPRTENGKTVYDVTPEQFAQTMVEIAGSGARILGGCCGTTPEHIAAVVAATKDLQPVPLMKKDIMMVSSYTHAVEFGEKPVLIGERINPTGKKKFKQALRDHDIDYVLQEGLSQQEKQVDVLDVNVGLPEIDEVAMMEEVVQELQAVLDLPLQIDTTNLRAMERALRLYNGKAMINSVNGKEESMHSIFPLVQKYGGVVVALTLDESGIPETAEGRIAIAKRIYAVADTYGIEKKDIIVDPLCMTISTDDQSARVTLDALKGIKEQLGGKTSLGVSNISFGLPNRDDINGVFFTMAMENGLSAAIMNPNSYEMRKAYYAFCALHGIDAQCGNYIQFASEIAPKMLAEKAGMSALAVNTAEVKGNAGISDAATGSTDSNVQPPLVRAIVKGLKEQAAAITEELLATEQSITIIDGYLIPALDIVGKGFEEKKVFLPQLLMSAEAAKVAFDVMKEKLTSSGMQEEKKGKIVLATVKGDIHDIGKNIVKVLLENYSFDVIDLGKDVTPEAVVQVVTAQHVPLVGLSALMTTTVPAMEDTIKQLREAAPWCKVVVGGAVLTQEYADMIGADKYAKDAMESVRYAEMICR
ncbi:MAG: homocysteine methyltransferase [Lachnospiraceae bacterium]|nr:homocysteine methyltransferase [Lachnospiraceae bacterium]